MMKTSVILSFLLCWSFVSPNPHHEKSNDKSVGESNHINDASDPLVGKEYLDEAFSGKDWGGDSFKFLNFFHRKDVDNTDKIHQADNKSFLDKLIYRGSNSLKTLVPKNNELSDNSLFGNNIALLRKNAETITRNKLFTNKDNLIDAVPKIKESESIDEKIEKHSNRARRDLRMSDSGLLWANPHKGGISEHLLKLNDGNNVLKSERATVAEALNGRAAIRRILAQAKAKAAKAAQYQNLYDNDDFSKWLMSESSFDTNIFKHPFRPSYDSKIIDDNKNNNSETANTESTNHDHHREIKHSLPNSTATGIADTDRSYTKLLHKSEHQKHLSSKLESNLGEKHGRDTNEMLHKLTVSRHTHGLSSYEDEEDTGLQHTSSHAPHMHFRITKDQETGNNISKWMHMDSSRANASQASDSAESYEFETSDERQEYGEKFIFKTSFEPGEDEGRFYLGQWKKHNFSDEINIPETDEIDYDLADFLFQQGSSTDLHREKNIKNKNKQNLDEIQYSIIHSTSTETKEGNENKQSENMLVTNITTNTSTWKPANIDIEHYHSRDQNVAANSVTSFSSSLSDDKESKRTTNVLASPSIDDGSATVKTKTENHYSLLGRTHSVIDNDATSTGIEIGFRGIKSHPPVGSSTHSSLSHAHSKTRLGNQEVRRNISEYERSAANTVASATKHLMDPKTLTENQNKDHDLKVNQEITADITSSTETTSSTASEHRQRAASSDEGILDEENYAKARRKYMDLKKKYMDRYKTSIEVIDLDDSSAEVIMPEFPVYKHGKAHALHDVNYYDFDDQEMNDDEKIEFDKDLKEIQLDYDNSEEEEKFTNDKASKESEMIISNDRYSQHGQNHKYNQHNYRNHYNKKNRDKDNRYHHHNTYNQYKHQNNHYTLNQQANVQSSASDATEFDTWNKYIYFIQDQERGNDESNASFESSVSVTKEGKKQNNAKHNKKKLLKRGGKKYISDEDKHHYLKKHTNLSGPVKDSIEINKIASINNNEVKIKNENKNKSKIVTRVENLISDGSTVDITSRMKHSNKKINNNNNYYSQLSWELMSLKNSGADVQTETKRVYDKYGGNVENVDINTDIKHTAKARQSTESKSNLQSASARTSESNNIKKIAAIGQASNEKISSSDIASGYQDYKISDSSKLTTESQMGTKIRHSNEKLKNTHEINADVNSETLKTASSSNTINKSRSNIQNEIKSSSKSSTKSQIGFWDYWNIKNYNTTAKASADATVSLDVENKQKSVENALGNVSTFSKLTVKSEGESKKYPNDLKNVAISTDKSEALSRAASKSSIESKIKTEQKSNHYNSVQREANVIMSSTAMSDNVKNKWLLLPSRMSQSKSHLTSNEDNRINSISKASTESMLSNVIEDKNRCHLQKLFSSSSSLCSELKHKHDNSQKNKINVSTAEASIQSTIFNNSDNGRWSDLSKSSSLSEWSQEKHVKNKHDLDNVKVDHKGNIGVMAQIGETSSGIVKHSHQQESASSLSSSSSSAKSQILNKNTKTIITSNNVFDKDEHNLLHASSSASHIASKNNLSDEKSDSQTTDTATINNDKCRRKDKILKTKWFIDLTNKNNNEKYANNKSIEKNEMIKSQLENTLNAVTSVNTVTSTDIKNVINKSSSSNSKAKSWTHDKLISSKVSNNIEDDHKNKLLAISSLFDSHIRSNEKRKNHMDIMENNQKSIDTTKTLSKSLFSTNNKRLQNDLVKETTLSEIFEKANRKRNNFNMSREKFEDTTNKVKMETISNSANNIYHHNNLLKDTSVILNKNIQSSNKIKDKNEMNAYSKIEDQINSKRMKYLKEDNNINELLDLKTLNSFNNKDRNKILKMTSDDLYADMSQRDQHKSDILSNINRIASTNIQDEHRHGLISSTDIKIQSMIDQKSDTLKKEETVHSETRNSINKWNTKFQTSSFLNEESQNRKKTVSESTANNINKDAHDSMQEKFAFNLTNIAKANKQHNYDNQEADVANTERVKARISNSQHFIKCFKNDAKEKTQLQQNKLKHQKMITSNIKVSEEANSSEIENAHQRLLKDVTASNSRTRVQHKHISDIVKESLKVTGSAATSAQTKSSEKVENKVQEKLVKNSATSNSYAKSQIEDKNNSSALKEKQIIASVETITNSAIFDNLKNVRENKLNKNLLSDPEFHDTYTRNENRRKTSINNLANHADTIISAKETRSNIIKDKYESDVKITSDKASLSNSYAETNTIKSGYNPNLQRESIQTKPSSDIRKHVENKNTVNNMEEKLKAVANTMTSAISSNSIESTNRRDSSKILSSSNLYTASQLDNVHSRNIAQIGKERIFTITQASPTSLVTFINNQDKQKDILNIQDSKNQRLTKIKKNNLLQEVYDVKDAAVSRQTTSFNNVKNERQNNLFKATSLINSFADTQSIQKDESSFRRKQHLITTDSVALQDSNISGCIDSINKNNLEKLTGISSSNSYSKFNEQNKNHADILKKKRTDILNANRSEQAIISSEFKNTKQDKLLRMTSSAKSYTETKMKNDNINGIKEALDTALNAKVKTIPFNKNIKNNKSHGLLDLLDPAKEITKNKNISQKDTLKEENLSETSLGLFSKAQVENALDSKILKEDYENSATVNTMIKTKSSNYHNQQDLHKMRSSSSNAQNSQHNTKSISSENSHRAITAANKNIVKNEKDKKDEKIIFNLSTLKKMKMGNMNKKEYLNNWPITITSDTATFANESIENKDKLNDSKTEKVAAQTEMAATNNYESEQHDIQKVKDRSKLEDKRNAETKIRNAILNASDAEMIALKRRKNKTERKSILDKLETLSSNEANAQTQIIKKEKYGVMDTLGSSVNTEETQSSITSTMSSASGKDIDLGTKYDQINNKMSASSSLITSVSKDTKERERHLSSVQTSLHLSDKINGCNKDVETKEFISQVTRLYKIMAKQQDSEILLMKRNSKGPVQVASFKNNVSPLIAYRLIPREVYERIRKILAIKQISCTNCPLSNSSNK